MSGVVACAAPLRAGVPASAHLPLARAVPLLDPALDADDGAALASIRLQAERLRAEEFV